MAKEREEAGIGKKTVRGLGSQVVLNKQIPPFMGSHTVMALSTLDHSVELNPLLMTSSVTSNKILDL